MCPTKSCSPDNGTLASLTDSALKVNSNYMLILHLVPIFFIYLNPQFNVLLLKVEHFHKMNKRKLKNVTMREKKRNIL